MCVCVCVCVTMKNREESQKYFTWLFKPVNEQKMNSFSICNTNVFEN